MRKFTVLVLLLAIMASVGQAQTKSRTGFRAGANYSTQRITANKESNYSDYVVGLNLALYRQIPLSPIFAFQPEFAFNSMGGKVDRTTTRLSYISFPFLFKIHGKHFGLLAGPQPSLLVGAKSTDGYSGSVNIKSELKSIDLAAITGIEYAFGKNNSYNVSLRYLFALNNIQKDALPGEKVGNYGLQLSVGFLFK